MMQGMGQLDQTNHLSNFLDGNLVISPSHAGADANSLSSVDMILDAVRKHLGMEIAFASRIADGMRQFTHIRSDIPLPLAPGDAEPLDQSLCQLVLNGTLPPLMHDASQFDAARSVPITLALPIGSHMNVPLRLSDGTLYGTFCCVSRQPDLSLTERDLSTLRAFADLAARQVEQEFSHGQRRAEISERIANILAGDSLTIVQQPIHDLRTGVPVGVECLARFPDNNQRGPDKWFADAEEIGKGLEMEMLAICSALKTLPHLVPGHYMSINASPETIISGAVLEVVSAVSADRLVLEITEHNQVRDYGALMSALEPLRKHARIAIDDVGAGYAGLRHIVDLKPDILKLDMSLTRDISHDPARRALAQALVVFARDIRCKIVAEGVETAAERATLEALRVDYAQGYFFSRPMPVVAAQQLLLGRREADLVPVPQNQMQIARRA
jgi:EAL domain-containing protein (putative c-di-GMP-specific phosphodiesterase class I)